MSLEQEWVTWLGSDDCHFLAVALFDAASPPYSIRLTQTAAWPSHSATVLKRVSTCWFQRLCTRVANGRWVMRSEAVGVITCAESTSNR